MRTPQEIINEITSHLKVGERYIYRGINEIFDGDDRIKSSLYLKFGDEKDDTVRSYGQKFITVVESRLLEKAKRYFDPPYSNIKILTELRHFGKKVNLIDFSHDLNVALFFACYGRLKGEPGEVFLLPMGKIKEMSDVNYDALDDGVIKPIITDTNKERVEFQSSIFVYSRKGFVPKDWGWKSFRIEDEEKESMLEYLEREHGISVGSIYNDLMGFILYEDYGNSRELVDQGDYYRGHKKDYDKAEELFGKAIRTDPWDSFPYYWRGQTRQERGNLYVNKAIQESNDSAIKEYEFKKKFYFEGAIRDYEKALKLSYKGGHYERTLYYQIGSMYTSLKKTKEATKYFQKQERVAPGLGVPQFTSLGIPLSEIPRPSIEDILKGIKEEVLSKFSNEKVPNPRIETFFEEDIFGKIVSAHKDGGNSIECQIAFDDYTLKILEKIFSSRKFILVSDLGEDYGRGKKIEWDRGDFGE